MQPVVIVHNPVSGSGRAARLAARAGQALAALGIAVRQEPTAARGDGAAIAGRWKDRCRALLAVGGDGTLREVLEGLSGSPTPIATLPAGTSNLLARALGLRPDPLQAAAVIAAGRTRCLDALRIETLGSAPRTGVLFVGAGFDAAIVADVAARRARAVASGRSGNLSFAAYALPALRAFLAWRPPALALAIDGAPLAGGPWGWVLAANLGLYAYGMRLGAGIAPDDGVLDLLALRARSRLALDRKSVV